jgi:alkaline phosphatase
MLQAVQQLDATVAVARRYVAAHPDTLLVVTGDHECGGLTVEGTEADDETGTGDSVEDGPFPVAGGTAQFVLDWTTTGHTDVPVPVTAEGPGAEALTGQHPNTYVHEVLARTLGIRT